MKKVFFLALSFVVGYSVMAQETTDQLIKVNSNTYSFGKIKQGVPVSTYFEITNISNKPIMIESATASCGCTTPEYSREPIAPNATVKLKVGYNAIAMNHFDKPVTIKIAGAQDVKQVVISGDVVDEATYTAYLASDEYKAFVAAQEGAKTSAVKTKVKEKKGEKKIKSKES